ncbi:Sulfotransferase domain superfamily [Coleofasciculus chthonoplastes PCC 7420]|uniref:Sulfotransferase domain superfamily n=1 Tax=Coleofasciculus chthonoplastes PCC 7420 TaxID=118168 RepID=B4W1M6_9CYAN|nr:sulfotransferase [Coleofasciculus chthonoplastes]EDX72001.1 Sulfotransferase domain superfamily [Coleofasciculus chthonoplastes PCC 7420]
MIKQAIKKVVYPIYPIIKSQPDFLVIGVQRAATTSLYRYLIQHPQILVTHKSRETYYFDNPGNHRKGFGWYVGHFPSKLRKGDKLTFEDSPSYLYYKHIPKLIKQDLGNIKMIAILRNPVDRAYSAWQMYHSYSSLPLKHLRERADQRTFAQAIEQEFNPELPLPKYPYNYLDRGKYGQQLENYYTYFDKNNILVLNFEQLSNDLGSALQQICDFLNIEPFPDEKIKQFQNEKYAAAKYVRSSGDEQVLERLKNYFVPFNEKLYELLGTRYTW